MDHFITLIFNTPLFYIIGLAAVIILMYLITRGDLHRLENQPQAVLKQDRHHWTNEPVTRKLRCAGCGMRLTPAEAYYDTVDECHICQDCLDEIGPRSKHSFLYPSSVMRTK